ncbi:hypothetical protein GCM10028775_37630 [Catellatospora paridis]
MIKAVTGSAGAGVRSRMFGQLSIALSRVVSKLSPARPVTVIPVATVAASASTEDTPLTAWRWSVARHVRGLDAPSRLPTSERSLDIAP